MTIFGNPNALPRAFLVDEVRVLPDAHAVLRAMAERSFQPGAWAYSEAPIEGLERSPEAGSAADSALTPGPPGTAKVEIRNDEEIHIQVDAQRSALLVHVNSWYPGWKAFVDGQIAPLHRVDHAFQGLVVEPGRHEVVFRYAPESFRWGAALSLAGLLAIGAGSSIFRQKR